MYNLDSNTQSEGRDLKIFNDGKPGIVEGVELTEVSIGKAENGNAFLKFTWTDESGATLSHFEWPVSSEDPEDFNKKLQSQMKRVKHILTKYVSEDKVVIRAKDFEDFANKAIQILGNSYSGVKVRLKVIYSYNNYLSVPKYVPFTEDMKVPSEESKLKITSFDKTVKDEQSNTSAAYAAASGDPAMAAPAVNEDDLPF